MKKRDDLIQFAKLVKFAEWVAKKITLEELEFHYPDKIWFLQSKYTDNKIVQFTTLNLFKFWATVEKYS